MLRTMVFAFLFLLPSFATADDLPQTLDDFVENITELFERGDDYNGLDDAFDPKEIMGSQMRQVAFALTDELPQGREFREMFRNQSAANGAVIIGLVVDGDDIATFLAFALAK
jgi:hypothetical protein